MLNKHAHLNGEIGRVVEVSLLKNSVTIETSKDTFTGSLEDAVELNPITQLANYFLYEGDIFKEKGKFYKIARYLVSNDNKSVILLEIDKQFQPVNAKSPITPFNADVFVKDYIESLLDAEQDVKRIGNVAYTQPEPSFDFSFDLKIVKRVVEGKAPVYLYAGNRKHDFEIDLIKVIFAGASIFPNESYIRKTYTYDEFEYAMTDGALQEASTYELEKVARAKMYGGHDGDDLEDDYNDEDFQDGFLD